MRIAHRKVRTQSSWDYAIAGTALALRFDGDVVADSQVVLNGAAPIPWRSEAVEAVTIGKKLN